MYTPLTEEPQKFHIFLYVGSVSVLILFCVIDLALDEWFKYCYWNIGLVNASSWNYSSQNSISDAHDLACGSFQKTLEYVCPELCTNLNHFEIAGGMMIMFSIFTFAGFGIVLIMHLLLLCKKKVNFRFAWLFMFLPFTSYLLGFIVYCAISDISGIKDVNSPNSGLDPKNFTWEGGMIFAVIIIILMSANLGHGMLFTRKYLTISNTPNN